MRRKSLIKILAGVMTAVLIVSSPAAAAEQAGAVVPGAETEMSLSEDGENPAAGDEKTDPGVSDKNADPGVPDKTSGSETPDDNSGTENPESGSADSEAPESGTAGSEADEGSSEEKSPEAPAESADTDAPADSQEERPSDPEGDSVIDTPEESGGGEDSDDAQKGEEGTPGEAAADSAEAEAAADEETMEHEEKAADVFSDFAEEGEPDEEDVSGSYGGVVWKIHGGELTVEGTGDFRDTAEPGLDKAPWFTYAERITSAVISLSGCTNLDAMFQNCANLESVDLISLNTSEVTSMSYMFKGCSSLKEINLSKFDTKKVTDMEGMFDGCSSLATLDLSAFDMSAVTNGGHMFDGCGALLQVDTPIHVKAETVIDLPLADEASVWYTKNETEVKMLPAGEDSDVSVTLYAKKELIPLSVELFAVRTGEDPADAKEIKGDIWMAGFEQDVLEYTGSAVTQDIRVYDRTTLLKKGTDYNLTYKNNTAAQKYDADGAPAMTIKLMKQYGGSRTYKFSILPADINNASISGRETALNYNGKTQEFKPVVKYRGKKLKKDTHYTIEYSGDSTTGKADGIARITYTVKGIGSFTGTYAGTYFIVGANYNLSKASVSVDAAALKYYGEPITKEKLNIAVKIKGQIVDPANYEVELAGFDDAGIGTLTIRPSGKEGNPYAGCFVKTYKIVGGVSFKSAVIVDESVWQASMKYNRTICEGDGLQQNTAGLLKDGSTVLTAGSDYTIQYKNNKKTGKAKAVFTGLGKYNGTFTKDFRITADDLIKVTPPVTAVYAKNGAVPQIEVRDRDGVLLKWNKDYTLKLTDHKKCGTASYRVAGKGNYAKCQAENGEGTFTVTPAQLSADSITAPDKPYKNKGNAYKSTPVLYDRQNNKKLKAGVDYEKDFLYDKKQGDTFVKTGDGDILPAGTTVRVTVKGMGNYEGTCSAEYKIYDAKKGIGKLYIKIDPQVYTGAEIKPELSDGAGGGSIHVYLSKGDMNMDVNEVYAPEYVRIVSYSKNIKVGTASVTLRAEGEYGGQKTYKFKIVPKSIELIGVSTVLVKDSCLNVSAGATAQLTVSVLPANADPWTVKWSSENTGVAAVDENGFVTTVGAGTTSIIATVTDAKGNDVKGSCKVFVDQKVVVLEATPDDGKNDTDEFNAAIRRVSSMNAELSEEERTILWVPAGVYHIDVSDQYKKIEVKSDVTIVMDDNAVLQALPTSRSEYYMVWIAGAKNVKLTGGKVIGDRKIHKGSGGADGHCIAVLESQNVTIENVDASYGWGDGIYVGIYDGNYGKPDRYVKDVTIKNCTVHHNRRNNIALTNGDDIKILNCTLKSHGINEGLCIETNKDSVPVTNVKVSDCQISGSVKEAMGVVRPAKNVTFTKCTFNGNAYNGACTGLVFDHCKITGDLTEVNHKGYSNFGYAKLIETDIGGDHIK